MAKGRPRMRAATSGAAVAQGVAHAGGGELGGALASGLGHRDAEAELRAVLGHGLRAAGAVLAEGDVEADRDVGHAQALVQHALGELAVGQVLHLGVERQDVEQVDAQGFERAGLLAGGHQAEGRGVGLEDAAGVRLEADHPQRRAGLLGGAGGERDHRLVPAMDAVEIAERDRGAAVGLGQALPAVDDTHGPQAPSGFGRRGTMIRASPSTTVLPSTWQTVAKVAWPRRSSRASTVTRVVTGSPTLTGRRKRRVWDR